MLHLHSLVSFPVRELLLSSYFNVTGGCVSREDREGRKREKHERRDKWCDIWVPENSRQASGLDPEVFLKP